jgi:hypothetical protein
MIMDENIEQVLLATEENCDMAFEVLMAVSVKITVVWDDTIFSDTRPVHIAEHSTHQNYDMLAKLKVI